MKERASLLDPGYKGEKPDPELKTGPLEHRRCTDVLCLIIFLLFWGVMAFYSYEGYKNGDPEILGIPMDPDGFTLPIFPKSFD